MSKAKIVCHLATAFDQPIYLICGCPGSGKTWIIDQVKHRFRHIYHDSIPLELFVPRLAREAKESLLPIIADVPFRTSHVVEALKEAGFKVKALYIVEEESVVRQRHLERGTEFKPYHSHRVRAMKERSKTHADFYGTSRQVLDWIKQNMGLKE